MVNYNGTIYAHTTPLWTVENRSFRYGDGVFETMRCINGRIPLIAAHLQRLYAAMEVLKMQRPSWFSQLFFEQEIQKILPSPHARIRLTVARQDGGLYTPNTHEVYFCIESTPLTSLLFSDLDEGLTTSVYDEVLLSPTPYSSFKTNNMLPYVLAAIYRQEQKVDESLLINFHHNLVEATSANIFLIHGQKIYTPTLAEGCLAGIMRQYVIQTAPLYGYTIEQQPISLRDLSQYESILLTNTQQGIRWVATVKHQTRTFRYRPHALSQQLILRLNQLYQNHSFE